MEYGELADFGKPVNAVLFRDPMRGLGPDASLLQKAEMPSKDLDVKVFPFLRQLERIGTLFECVQPGDEHSKS